MSNDASEAASAPKRPAARLTLEEKLWFDRRKNDLEQYAAFGAGIGAVIAAGVTCTSSPPSFASLVLIWSPWAAMCLTCACHRLH